MRPLVKEAPHVVRGDVLEPASLGEALHGVHTAYYLVHLMSDAKDFETEDRQAATNNTGAAPKAGVRRIVDLGGLGDAAVKGRLEEILQALLAPIRERRAALAADAGAVLDVLRAGTQDARKTTQATLDDVRAGLGLFAFEPT